MTSRVSHRSMFAGSVSLALHGGVVLLAFLIAGVRVVQPPRVIELTEIQVVAPPPPPPGPSRSGTRAGSGNTAKMGALGRRGHDAMPRSQTRAPAVANPFADLAVSYETPTLPDPGSPAGTTGQGVGTGLFGTGTGAGAGYGSLGDGPGLLQVPPPPPSLARPPRPKNSHSASIILGSHEFANKTLLVELNIDPHGNVRDVRILEGLSNRLDTSAAKIARDYKFYPALSDNGEPTSGHYLWKFVINDISEDDREDDDGGRAEPEDGPVGGRPSTHIRR